jgi:ribosomal protein L31
MEGTTREVMYPCYTLTHFKVPYVTENEELCIYQYPCKIPILYEADSKSIIFGLGATKTKADGNLVFVMEVEKPKGFEDFMKEYAESLSRFDETYLKKTNQNTPCVLVSSKPHYFYFGGSGKTMDGELGRFKAKFKIVVRLHR